MKSKFNNIVILTGAGISAESGVVTFRGNGGLWEGYRVEEVATPEAFQKNPELVQRFYNQRRKQLTTQIAPNSAHYALAKFETAFLQSSGNSFDLITQNVDDLHERAGSKNLIHMHGELLKARSVADGSIVDWCDDLHGSTMRPHIVWFGETPFYLDYIYLKIEQCDLFIAIGTSGHVYPAAGFVDLATRCGAHTVEINIEDATSNKFRQKIIGPATETVGAYLSTLLQ